MSLTQSKCFVQRGQDQTTVNIGMHLGPSAAPTHAKGESSCWPEERWALTLQGFIKKPILQAVVFHLARVAAVIPVKSQTSYYLSLLLCNCLAFGSLTSSKMGHWVRTKRCRTTEDLNAGPVSLGGVFFLVVPSKHTLDLSLGPSILWNIHFAYLWKLYLETLCARGREQIHVKGNRCPVCFRGHKTQLSFPNPFLCSS